MLPMLAGAGIMAAGGLVGGMLGSSSAQRSQARQQAWEKEVMQNAIQWRMSDAKAAGVHPIYALGAQVAQGSTGIPLSDPLGPAVSEMGQNIGNVVARSAPVMERQRHELELQLGAANLAESDARRQMYLSEAAKNRQAGVSGLGIMGDPVVEGQSPNVSGMANDLIDVRPPQVDVSKADYGSIIAGSHPTYQLSVMGPRGELPLMHYKLQGESLAEMMESMPWYEKLGMINQNRRLFGQEWVDDFLGWQLFGITPSRKYTLNNPGKMRYEYIDQIDRQGAWLGTKGREFLEWSKQQGRRYKRRFNK